jgi:hypothetical protein
MSLLFQRFMTEEQKQYCKNYDTNSNKYFIEFSKRMLDEGIKPGSNKWAVMNMLALLERYGTNCKPIITEKTRLGTIKMRLLFFIVKNLVKLGIL